MPTIKLILEYDGTAYAGWQRQATKPTIQAAVEAAIATITQSHVTVIGAGRTDAGAHALGQVASFRTGKELSMDKWEEALNGLLPCDICIRSAQLVPDAFHARYSASSKHYLYRILNRRARSALDRHRAWHIRHPLDHDAMQEAAQDLLGRHDFSSFQGSPTDTRNPICHLTRLAVTRHEDDLLIEAEADRFLKQMVRAMVGTLVDIGRGKRTPRSAGEVLAARDRRAAGYTAPAHGLYLLRVDYP